MPMASVQVMIVTGTSLPSQAWWPQLHAMINEAFMVKNFAVFPPTWTRLDTDPQKGAEGLAQELGKKGHIVVISDEEGKPIASSGVLPFRGENWINELDSHGDVDIANGEITKTEGVSPTIHQDYITDWETCCFCVHASNRGQGLAYKLLNELIAFVKPIGAKRLVSNYAVEETGNFWPKLGFEVMPSAGGMLPKGFQINPEKEGLREDIYFKMGAKALLNGRA